MLRPFAAGLMCLGFVTLGVAATWGQDDADDFQNGDVVVVEKVAETARVPEGNQNRVEISIGADGAAAVVTEQEPKEVEARQDGREYVVEEKDGKIVRRIQAKPHYARLPVGVQFAQIPVFDAATREAVEKLIAGLKDEVKKLEREGRKEDAEKKTQSIRALEQTLNPGQRWGAIAGRPMLAGGLVAEHVARFREGGPAAEELKKLHARLDEFRAQDSKKPSPEEHARIQEEIARIHKQIAENQQHIIAAFPQAGPFPPGAPGAAMAPFAPGQPFPPGWPAAGAGPGGFAVAWKGPSPEADVLAQKAGALTHAAAQLQQAGLEDQSRELFKQAEKLRAESEKIRAQQPQHGHAAGHFVGGPPHELLRSIHELQEQIQQLRKEVGELRELLQRR